MLLLSTPGSSSAHTGINAVFTSTAGSLRHSVALQAASPTPSGCRALLLGSLSSAPGTECLQQRLPSRPWHHIMHLRQHHTTGYQADQL